MLQVVIIDDEQNALDNLNWELNKFKNEVVVQSVFIDPALALKYLEINEVDAVFLDIEMPQMNGIDFLNYFPQRKFAVIVTSAYDKYAIEAIKHQCLDYLSKPVDSDDLNSVIKKIQKFKKEHSMIDYFEETLMKAISKNNTNKKIGINADGRIVFLMPNEIVYCESDGNYSTIFLENGKKIVISQKLKTLEEKFSSEFYRVHNSYIINLNKVQEYFKNDGYVILTNMKKIPVSRQKKSDFLDMF